MTMSSPLQAAVVRHDEGAVREAIAGLAQDPKWSLTTTVDELAPLLVMETNLTYGSFHTIKMALFLRRLAQEGWLSRETEAALGQLIGAEAVRRDWINIRAEGDVRPGGEKASSPEALLTEIGKGNSHNAFHYALELRRGNPRLLMRTLLRLGAAAIPDTLGHSLSCFFSVVEDLIGPGHPAAATGLLSYVMYLCRHGADEDVLEEDYETAASPLDYGGLLRRCASGGGIVNLHHMITFFVMTAWEQAEFNANAAVPFGIILDWLEGKELDEERQERAAHVEPVDEAPDTYDGFASRFRFDNVGESVGWVYRLLDEQPKRAVDWLVRLYAAQYESTGGWDPHYYTGLYSALRLYTGNVTEDQVACRMAVEQALVYFAKDVV